MMRKGVTFILAVFIVLNLVGCEAFVRKFTRKSKKDKAPEEMVLAPEEWKGPQMTHEELYRQYLLYWQSWQDELINTLGESNSYKKRNDCILQAIKNLTSMKALLNETQQKQLGVYLKQMIELQDEIKADVYGSVNNYYRRDAEKIRRNILQRFSYNHIKNDLL
ncbi:MAG: hypothetical protein NTZ63_05100 [Candidatus Omnitrophica bacterium]|nr:hypothetical protein [Candidatus Omnitrophota bacterium]